MRGVFLLTVSVAALAGVGANDVPRWHSNVAEAFAEARRAHKPILAVLHCPH